MASKTRKINKWLYGWKLYVNYGQGWEYEIFEERLIDIKQRAKEYRENAPYPVKVSEGRELNPGYKGK